MAGIYIHIPFCASKCSYCDFYSLPAFKYKQDYLNAIAKEIDLCYNDFLSAIGSDCIKTIYIGGGTPSSLAPEELEFIYNSLSSRFDLSKVEEITIEANPENLTDNYIKSLTTLESLHVNRMSIGIQTFQDSMLKTFRRRHNALESIESVKRVKNHGIKNISLDIIYAFPDETIDILAKDLDELCDLSPAHISAYQLTYEPSTLISRLYNSGKVSMLSDDKCAELYYFLIKKLEAKGYNQYEISNFSLPGFESKHNSSYWNMTPYLGLGPSAHSFYSNDRFHNPPSLTGYIKSLFNGESPAVAENLTKHELYNDFIITSLRTRHGINPDELKSRFGSVFYDYFFSQFNLHVNKDMTESDSEGNIRLTQKGIMISDTIFSELLWV